MDKNDGLQPLANRNGSIESERKSKVKSKSKYTLILNQFLSNVRRKTSVAEFKGRLVSCVSTGDRINLVNQHFNWTPVHPLITSKYQKNTEVSRDFRNVGNVAYQNRSFVDAVRAYNLALLFALPGEPEVGLAYANRSAALHGMGQTKEAIEDIVHALCNGYPDDEGDKRGKLQERKMRYEVVLKAMESDPFEGKVREEVKKRDAFCQEMFTVKSPNYMAPAIEDFVEIQVNEERGRHLVAKRDIPIGTTVLVETPFVTGLENALNFDVDHCHHCLKKNIACLPCPNCVFALYCDEKCRSEAFKDYHRYECPCLPELHCLLQDDRLLKHFYLVFKLICLVGPKKLYTIFSKGQTKMDPSTDDDDDDPVSRAPEVISGCDPCTGIYAPDSYHAVYNLMEQNPVENNNNTVAFKNLNLTSINNRNDIDLDLDTGISEDPNLVLILMCLILSQTLSFYSDFFDHSHDQKLETKPKPGPEISELKSESEFTEFIAQLLLHHFEKFQRHIFELGEFTSKCGKGNPINLRSFMKHSNRTKCQVQNRNEFEFDFDFDFNRFAIGIFPTLSLLNHSCDPSVTRFTGKSLGKTAVVTLKPIKFGEELLISYGPIYGSHQEIYRTSKLRQATLLKGYHFKCQCIACQNDWPCINELIEIENNNSLPEFCCSNCSPEFFNDRKMGGEFLKCILLKVSNSRSENSPSLLETSQSQCGRCNRVFLIEILMQEFNYHREVLGMCRSLILSNSPLQVISPLTETLQFLSKNVCPPNYRGVLASQFFKEAVDLIILFST